MRAPHLLSLPGLVLCLFFAATPPAEAQTELTTRRIASGLNNPLWAGAPAGDDRIFIAQKNGAIKILENGEVNATRFLKINDMVSNGSEQGLLGVVFHPNYANNGTFFLNYTKGNGNTVVSRWTVSADDPNVADAESEEVLLTVNQPFENHNGGCMAFGPDGYLYIGMGDGGAGDDPDCRAQDLTTLHGKMLRIDVDAGSPYGIPPDNPFLDTPGALPEIYHLGLRNPWRFSFDRATGDMYIGDVGQDAREEISVAAAGEAGLNFGWKRLEGTRCNSKQNCPASQPGCSSAQYTDPIYELTQGEGARSITGGFVYRGCAIPDLVGTYFFTDYIDDKLRTLEYDPLTGIVSNFMDRTNELVPDVSSINAVASFGEDGFGELLIVKHTSSGAVFKVVPATATEATADVRNGSETNPTCLSSRSKPILGNNWRIEVDLSGHPAADMTGLVAMDATLGGVFFPEGELLVDTFHGNLIFLNFRAQSGDLASFPMPVPCDPAFDGFTFHVQAFVVEGNTAELCNALDVSAGYY